MRSQPHLRLSRQAPAPISGRGSPATPTARCSEPVRGDCPSPGCRGPCVLRLFIPSQLPSRCVKGGLPLAWSPGADSELQKRLQAGPSCRCGCCLHRGCRKASTRHVQKHMLPWSIAMVKPYFLLEGFPR